MSNSRLYFAAAVACMTAALFGYSVGFIGGVIVLPSFLRHFNLFDLSPNESAATRARIVLVWIVGAFFGVPLCVPACQRLGRRACLGISALLYVLGAVMQLINFNLPANTSLAVFELGRFINGLGVGAGTLVSPMYISEISPPAIRGMLMSGYQTVLQFFALVGFWGAFATHAIFPSSSNLQWQLPVLVQLLPSALLLLGTFLVPETPIFWAEKRQWEKVEDSLSWLRGVSVEHPDLQNEVNTIKRTIDMAARAQMMHEPFYKEILRPGMRNRLGVGIGIMIANNMVGLNALNYYSPVIFVSAGFTTVSSSLFLTGVFGIVKVISAVAFMFWCVNNRGNRFWLQVGCATMAVSMLVLSCLVHGFTSPDPASAHHLTAGGIISVLMVYIFTFAFGVSLGPISWNVCGEIFPSHINAKCCAITICTQWLFQGVIATMTPFLLTWSGWATYLIYCGFCTLTLIWVVFYVPETRGVALGREMDKIFGLKGEEEDIVDESSALLRNEHVRKASFASLS